MFTNTLVGAILIIDDEPGFGETARELFEGKTAVCHYVEEIEEAVKKLEGDAKKQIALVLLDIRLKLSDKWHDHLNEIKRTKREVTIILMTSLDDYKKEESVQKMRQYGAAAFLPKPSGDKTTKDWDSFINKILEYITMKYVKIDTQFLLQFWNRNKDNINFHVDDQQNTIPASGIRDKIIQKYFNFNDGYRDVIRSYINQSRFIDWLLNITNKRYRDHYNHQFNVGLLGWFLLHVEVFENKPLWQYYCECESEYKWEKEEIELAWWIAALLHDHGYPIAHLLQSVYARNFLMNPDYMDMSDHIKSINSSFMVIYSDIICTEFFDHTKNYDLKASKKEFQKLIEEQVFKICKENYDIKNFYDHGVISAVNLALKLSGYMNDKIIQEAVKAIFWHNLEDKNNIAINKNPITFLLVLCDSIQEWGRTIIIENEPYMETDKIFLGLYTEIRGSRTVYKFPPELKLGFVFDDNKTLKTTKWEYGKFIDSLLKNICRLKFFPTGPDNSYKPKRKEIKILSTHN